VMDHMVSLANLRREKSVLRTKNNAGPQKTGAAPGFDAPRSDRETRPRRAPNGGLDVGRGFTAIVPTR